MSTRRFGDRGIGAFLKGVERTSKPDEEEAEAREIEFKQVSVKLLHVSQYQPREHIDDNQLNALAESIKARGVLQPILVRPADNGMFEIIAGERRWRAAKLANLENIPVRVCDDVDDHEAVAIALIENIQRENLNPMEEAVGFERLQVEFDLTQEEIAQVVGKSRSTIANSLRLLNLCKDVQLMVRNGDIEMGHGRALLALNEETQLLVAQQIFKRAMSVRQAEQLIREILENEGTLPKKKIEKEPDNRILERQEGFSQLFGTKVRIQHGAKGDGNLLIKYDSIEDLDRIMDLVKKS